MTNIKTPPQTEDLFPSAHSALGQGSALRPLMNGKPVFAVPSKSVINFDSGFKHKLLCDGPTFSTGSACAYSCAFCYVPDMMRKLRALPSMAHVKGDHESIIIRRTGALETLRKQLTDRHGRPKFADPSDNRVIYSSPLVDVAANMDFVSETIEACKSILELTHWQIRLLSKSNLLPKVAQGIPEKHRHRVIYGVSTGTLDDKLAKAFEQGTPLVSKRLASLHWLQDNGFRTYGMVCPSLPQDDYQKFADDMATAIRADRCEHVWGEVINVRGESMVRTVNALREAGFRNEALSLQNVSTHKEAWEEYARATFWAESVALANKLRFLQYVSASTKEWWAKREVSGAILL